MTSSGRQILLGAMGEDEFSRQVKRWARRYGWHGRHVRYSQGVIEGVHTLRVDGHSDAHGALDWEFVHDDPNLPLLKVELKTATGRPTPDQQRELSLVAGRRVGAYIWRPDMESEIKTIFTGLGG